MVKVLSRGNCNFQELGVFLHPFIISIKYEGSINVVETEFFMIWYIETLVRSMAEVLSITS